MKGLGTKYLDAAHHPTHTNLHTNPHMNPHTNPHLTGNPRYNERIQKHDGIRTTTRILICCVRVRIEWSLSFDPESKTAQAPRRMSPLDSNEDLNESILFADEHEETGLFREATNPHCRKHLGAHVVE
jgi:hypothetical protein